MASRNQSNNETTIKSTLRAMPGDFWTLDSVSLFCNYKNSVMLPDGFILEDYRDYFEQYLVEVDVAEEYYYSPSLFAEVQYGTPDLDFLVMYFARMTSLFEFKQPRIKILPVTMLSDLNKLIVQKREEVKASKSNPKEYSELEDIVLPNTGYISQEISTNRNLRITSVISTNASKISNFSTDGSYELPPVPRQSSLSSTGEGLSKSSLALRSVSEL